MQTRRTHGASRAQNADIDWCHRSIEGGNSAWPRGEAGETKPAVLRPLYTAAPRSTENLVIGEQAVT